MRLKHNHLVSSQSLILTLSVFRVGPCSDPEEFYVDGQPMCCHREITAGTENGSTTEAATSKARVTVFKIDQGHYHHTQLSLSD